MPHNKRSFAVLSILLLAAMVLAACSGSANAQGGATSSGFTGYGTVTQSSFTNTVESTGQIQPLHIASLSFSTTGTVLKSNAQVGQAVKAGDVLMTLDPTSVPANLQTAQTDLTNAVNALNQLTNPDLSTISTAQKALSAAYTAYQQAQSALSNAIINNQGANTTSSYTDWLNAKKALDTALNNLPLANASVDIQAYYQAVRTTSQLRDELTAAQAIASTQKDNTALAQKVTDLQKAVQDSQANQDTLKAGLDEASVGLVTTLSNDLSAYNTASAQFIGSVVTDTTNTNVNQAQIQADLTSKQSSLLTAQSTLTDQQNKRAGMNGARCDSTTIANYQAIYDRALQRYEMSAHIIDSAEYNAMQTAAANLTWCSSDYSASEIAAADANIASTQAQIALLQAQIASDQAQISDSGASVYALAVSLNTVWTAYQDSTQQLSNAVTALYQLQRSPNPDDLASAQAKVQSAQAEVNSLNIISPFDGEVTSVGYLAGDKVSQGNAAVTLVDRSSLYVDLQVDESHVVELSTGDKATIALEAMPKLALTGSVTYINPVGASSQGVVYYDVRVVLDYADPTLLIGSTADVTIQAGQPQDVLTVPVSAVGSSTQGEYVYVIGSNGTPTQVAVTSGQILPDNMVIVTGNLKAGDTVGLLSTSSTSSNNNFGGGGGGRFLVP